MRRFGLLVLFSSFLIIQPAGGQDALRPAAVTTDGIELDLAALGDADFLIREAAARRLVSRKLDAVEPLSRLALAGNTEASVRAFEILRQLYREEDDALCVAIESSFEALAASENVSVAARAESSINAVGRIWHQRAVDKFVKCGGVIHYPPNVTPAEVEKEKYGPLVQDALINDLWKGGDDGLKYLRRIEDFRVQSEISGPPLFVVKGMISDDAMAALKTALPILEVQERGAACLGVSPGTVAIRAAGEGLPVFRVKEGSAADRAGIREGDTILTFDGHDITSFQNLVDRIGDRRPGEKVPVLIERDRMTETVIVELRRWE